MQQGQRILITGATGFIGRKLVHTLLDAGHTLSALTMPGDAMVLPEQVRCIECDITDAAGVTEAFREVKPAVVFHLAAAGVTNPGLPLQVACDVNVGGVINVLEAARTLSGVQRIVLVGSSYEYGAQQSDDTLDPFNAYSASKAAAWAFSRAAFNAWKLPVVWVRPFQVYGPGQRERALIPAAINAALNNEDFRMTAGEQRRDFIYVSDVIDGLVAAMVSPDIEGRILDLGTGTMHKLLDVIERIWALTGAQSDICAGALPYRPGEVPAIPANYIRTRILTGWQAQVELDDGLGQTIHAMQKNRAQRQA